MALRTLAHYPIGQGLKLAMENTRIPTATTSLQLETTRMNTLANLGQVSVEDEYLKKLIFILRENIIVEKLTATVVGKNILFTFHIKGIKEAQPTNMQDVLLYLNKVFLQNQSVLRHVKSQLDSITKIDDDSIESLRKLKEPLLEFVGYLDGILLFFSDMNSVVRVKPSLDKVKKNVEELKSIFGMMNTKQLQGLLSNVNVSEEKILCSIVGLQDSIAQRLENLNPEVRSHQDDMYFLIRFLSDNCECPDLASAQNMASKLKEMGFTESRSEMIANWIEKQPVSEHRSLLSWTELYVEYIFKYDIFLNECVGSYPYPNNVLNKWFSVPVKTREKQPNVNVDVSCCNTTRDHAHAIICGKLDPQRRACSYWFHGTDHKSAVNIVKNGIMPNVGKPKLDFSHGDGFYLNPDAGQALEWVEQLQAAAVIIFDASEEIIKEFTCLDLRSCLDIKWERVVKWYRSGMNIEEELDAELDAELENENTKCDYIHGPMVGDRAQYSGKNWKPQQIKNKKGEVKQQICVKSKKMAAAFGKPENIVGVVFLN